ncbi:hypothetical protein B0H13DRAFT_1923466 [Mycena leptocephala]|nr:hypothetical protein B0H13DRAFT_1923466 [Mycena leptocephala]
MVASWSCGPSFLHLYVLEKPKRGAGGDNCMRCLHLDGGLLLCYTVIHTCPAGSPAVLGVGPDGIGGLDGRWHGRRCRRSHSHLRAWRSSYPPDRTAGRLGGRRVATEDIENKRSRRFPDRVALTTTALGDGEMKVSALIDMAPILSSELASHAVLEDSQRSHSVTAVLSSRSGSVCPVCEELGYPCTDCGVKRTTPAIAEELLLEREHSISQEVIEEGYGTPPSAGSAWLLNHFRADVVALFSWLNTVRLTGLNRVLSFEMS